MRRLLIGMSTGLVLAAASLAPASAAADVQESIRVTTARAVAYGDAFSVVGDELEDYPYRPRMTVTTQVTCDAGREAVVVYGPVTAHQAPQVGPFVCTGGAQPVTIYPAAGEEGPVRVTTELRFSEDGSTSRPVAKHTRTVTATDLRAIVLDLAAPASVDEGQRVELTGNVQLLSHKVWGPASTTLTVMFRSGDEDVSVGQATSTRNGKVRFTTPPVTESGTWWLSWPRSWQSWSSNAVEVTVKDAGPQLPSAPGLRVGKVTTSTVDLHWSPPTSGANITGYRFGWVSANGKPVPSWEGDWKPSASNPVTMTNLAVGTRYTMWVAAITPQGVGKRAEVAVTTADAAQPAAPRVWAGKVTRSSVEVQWTNPAGVTNVTGYRLGWISSTGKPVPAWQGDWTATAKSPVTMTNLAPGTTYTMWVSVLTPQGEGARGSVQVSTLP